MTDIFSQDIKDLMKLATTDFDKFYAETEKANKDTVTRSLKALWGRKHETPHRRSGHTRTRSRKAAS
jgi:hypothetical protein